MTKDYTISEEEKQAIVNYLSDKYSLADSKILNNWLSKNNKNKLLFDQLSDIWQATKFKNTRSQIDITQAWIDIQDQININEHRRRKIVWNNLLRYAAVFIIAILLGGLGYYFISENSKQISEQSFVEYFAPLGSRSFVQLADGSKVWINAGSTLKYSNSFGTDNRELNLTGEAFFEVEKNKNLPFVVKTSEINVIAIGTKFNVKAYTEDEIIETTLIEGSVKLESSSVNLADNLILKPNEKAVFTKKNRSVELFGQAKEEDIARSDSRPKMEIIKAIDPVPIVSWKDKRWVIKNEKLGQLAIKLERRFGVNIIFDDEVLKEFSFGGTLEDENIEQILKVISYSSPIDYVIQDNTVYIMANKNKMNKFKELLME